MLRIVFAVLLATVSVSAAAQTRVPPSTRAYAPEDIGSLPVSDQIRVIENEYRDQSGGRELPDDQLDFYLDQVKYSRWTFSRIKSDIAGSLHGSGSGGWRPPAGNAAPAPGEACCRPRNCLISDGIRVLSRPPDGMISRC